MKNKQRLALGLATLIISTVGLYAVKFPKINNLTEEINPIQIHVNIINPRYSYTLGDRGGNIDREIKNSSLSILRKDITDKNENEIIVEDTTQVKETKTYEQKDVVVTAYTLSKSECGKNPWDKDYGITRNGSNLRGKNWQTARVIAVDPNIIPLNSIVLLDFYDEKYKIYSGEYIASDTGSAIKGNKIDLFYDETNRNEALRFGMANCKITILKNGNEY